MSRRRRPGISLVILVAVLLVSGLVTTPAFGFHKGWDQNHDPTTPDPPVDQDPPPDDDPDPTPDPDPDDPDCGDNPDQPQCEPDFCDQNPDHPLCTDEDPDCGEVPSHEKCDPDYCEEHPEDPFCQDEPEDPEDPDEEPEDPDDPRTPPDEPKDDDCNPGASPFEAANGSFSYDYTDLAHVYRGPDFVFTRVYYSRNRRSGPLGRGWTHSYDTRLIPVTDGVAVATLCRTGKGTLNRYRRQQDGSYRSPRDGFRSLVEEPDGSWTLTELDGMARRFDADGLLTAIRDRSGDEMTFGYDATGFLITVTTASSQLYTFSKGPNGKIASLTDPLDRTFWYDYDVDGHLTHVTNPINEVVEFVYGADGKLAQILDPLARVAQDLTFDSSGRLKSYIENGESWTVDYFPSKRKTIKTDAQGDLWKVYYNNNGNVVRKVDPLGGRKHWGYDSRLRPSWISDENGNTTYLTYGPLGNVVGITDPLGNTKTHNFDPATNLRTSTVSPSGKSIDYEYDAAGRLAAIRDALGRVLGYEYDVDGRKQRQIDANDQAYEFAHDSEDRVNTVTLPGGGVWQYTFDVVGNVRSVIDPDGVQLDVGYDDLDRAISMTDVTGGATTYSYAPSCPVCPRGTPVESIQDTAGRAVSFLYDAYGRVTQATSAAGDFQYTYAPNTSFLQAVSTPGGQSFTLVPDLLGRTVEVQEPVGSTFFDYDPASNTELITDPLGQQTFFSYNAGDGLTRFTDLETGQTDHAWDVDGNRASCDDATGFVETYSYDPRGRLTAIVLPDPQENVTFNWDEAASDNGTGRLTSVSDSGVVVRYHFDVDGELVREECSVDGALFTIRYDRSPGGRPTGMTLPSGIELSYTRDVRGFLEGVDVDTGSGPSPVVSSIVSDATGRPVSLTLGNGLVETWSYGADGRLTGVSVPGVLDQNLVYGTDGRIAGLTSSLDPSTNQDFLYDTAGRLQSATGPWGPLTFAYDSAGNRTGRTTAAGTDSFEPLGNRLQTINLGTTATYQYDAAGNVLGDGTHTYEYDQRGRLIRVADAGGTVAEYGYNNSNQRVKKTLPGVGTTYYHYDYRGRLVEETDVLGTSLRAFVYLQGRRPVALLENGQIFYYAVDHRYTPQALTDQTGAVVWSATFLPFGESWAESGTVEQPLRFAGQVLDAETGLHYNWHRYYDPAIGRYLQSDGVGLHRPIRSVSIGGELTYLGFIRKDYQSAFIAVSAYPYSYSDPVNLWDLDGLSTHWWEFDFGNPFNNPFDKIPEAIRDLLDKRPQCPAWHTNRNDNQSTCPPTAPPDDDPNWTCFTSNNPLHQPTPNIDYRGLGPNWGTQCIYDEQGNLRPGDGTYDYSPPMDEDGSHGPFDPSSYDNMLGHIRWDVLPAFREEYGLCR